MTSVIRRIQYVLDPAIEICDIVKKISVPNGNQDELLRMVNRMRQLYEDSAVSLDNTEENLRLVYTSIQNLKEARNTRSEVKKSAEELQIFMKGMWGQLFCDPASA